MKKDPRISYKLCTSFHDCVLDWWICYIISFVSSITIAILIDKKVISSILHFIKDPLEQKGLFVEKKKENSNFCTVAGFSIFTTRRSLNLIKGLFSKSLDFVIVASTSSATAITAFQSRSANTSDRSFCIVSLQLTHIFHRSLCMNMDHGVHRTPTLHR